MGYDASGRRMFKENQRGQTRYGWEGDRLIAEMRPNGEWREIIYYPGTFRPVALLDHSGQVVYFETDNIGLPHELITDGGEVAWSGSYGEFGNLERVAQGRLDNPLRFPGQYFDDDLGLYYTRNRYYDPAVKCFISQDPLGLLMGEHVYDYAPNPWIWADPLGLECRGRIQAQGGGTEKSVAWTRDTPPTRSEGLAMVDELESQLTPRERRDRAESLKAARAWINRAAQGGGVSTPPRISKSFLKKGSKDIRVDIEVNTGKAFVPDAD
jgi:RHS repeat-associated protein